MSRPPRTPRIYHITHVDNLPQIAEDGGLFSDAKIMRRGGSFHGIGMSGIKRRRIEEIAVPCHPGSRVGDYVPFYFCPRSIMLYVIYRANHPELSYRGGQAPIVHLEADLHAVIRWADKGKIPWAFSLGNAGAYHTEFRTGVDSLDALDWAAIQATDFRTPDVKEGKQAELLVHEFFPWHLVERVGVLSARVRALALNALATGADRPEVEVRREWYY